MQTRDLSSDVARIQEQVRSTDQQLSQDLSKYSGTRLDEMTHTKDVQVAAIALQQTGTIANAGTEQLPSIADEVNRIATDVSTHQDAIRTQNGLSRFFFGASRTVASSLSDDATRYQTEIDRLTQVLSSPTLNPSLRPVIQQQIQVLQQEKDRVSSLASSEQKNRGILGGLFG